MGLSSAPIPNFDSCDNLDNMASAGSKLGRRVPHRSHSSEHKGLRNVAHLFRLAYPPIRSSKRLLHLRHNIERPSSFNSPNVTLVTIKVQIWGRKEET